MPPLLPSAHTDTFARDRLPPPELWPELLFELPSLQFPDRLNCVTHLLDARVDAGEGARLAIQGEGVRWTYAELQSQVNRIANELVQGMGLVSGQRVLLRGANTPMLAACWLDNGPTWLGLRVADAARLRALRPEVSRRLARIAQASSAAGRPAPA